MKREKRNFSSAFKASVVLEALKEQRTISEIAREHELNPNVISIWKKQFTDNMAAAFGQHTPVDVESNKEIDHLHKKIGQLTVEIDWLKKKSGQLGGKTGA